MDFIYLFRVLMKKKWIILGAALFASVIALVFTRNQHRKYKSFAQISTGFTQTEDIRLNPSDDNAAGYNESDIKFNNVLVTASSPIKTASPKPTSPSTRWTPSASFPITSSRCLPSTPTGAGTVSSSSCSI